jgi:hypothetical protein
VNSLAKIEQPNSTEAQIWFSPSVEEQRELAKKFAVKKEQAGISGQFVVQYDVDRDPQAGEVLVSSVTKELPIFSIILSPLAAFIMGCTQKPCFFYCK